MDPAASSSPETLLEQTYDRLRRLARSRLEMESPNHTLQATALVHEAWLRLSANATSPQSPGDFIAAVSEIMRRVLVDHARRRLSQKRGGPRQRTSLPDLAFEPRADEILAVHDALSALEAHHPRAAKVVQLRYFAGLTSEEAAAALGISVPTASRDWFFARAWLRRELDASSTKPPA